MQDDSRRWLDRPSTPLLAKAAMLMAMLALGACAETVSMDHALVGTAPQIGMAGETTTLPFRLESQRVLIEVSFERPDGNRRTALAWFNMGMARPILSKALYGELGIGRGSPLKVHIGNRTIEVAPNAVVNGDGGVGVPDFSHLFAPLNVEAMLPASLFQNLAVSLDYRQRLFALTVPGTAMPQGIAVPAEINPETGIVSVETAIAGNRYPIAIDAGSGYTWIRGDVAHTWVEHNPDWVRADTAIGQANANMVDFELEKKGTLLRIPEMRIGGVELQNVDMFGTGPVLGPFWDGLVGDLFWNNWKKGAGRPVIGWIGGNILKHFKITIDFPNRLAYWQQQSPLDPHDLDQVAINLVRRKDRYFIGNLVHHGAEGTATELSQQFQIDDELISVDGFPVRGASKDTVITKMQGCFGDQHVIVIERAGAELSIRSPVISFY